MRCAARRITVAFPMPDRDLSYEMESEVAYPGDFHTMVDGRPVRMSVERRAVLNGVDRTADLTRRRVPISQSSPQYPEELG